MINELLETLNRFSGEKYELHRDYTKIGTNVRVVYKLKDTDGSNLMKITVQEELSNFYKIIDYCDLITITAISDLIKENMNIEF